MLRLGAWIVCVALCAPAPAGDGVFDVAKKPAERAFATIGPEIPILSGPQSAMTRRLAGVLAELDQGGVGKLRGCVSKDAAPPVEDATRVCYIQLFAGKDARTVEVLRAPTGALGAREVREPSDGAGDGAPRPGGRESPVVSLDEEKFFALSSSWSVYRAGFGTDSPAGERIDPGSIAKLAKPYSASWFRFDKGELGHRFLHNRDPSIDATDRPLGENAIWVRLPRGYDPKRPAGLLLWVSAGYLGEPPPPLHAAADELGLICVGPAGAGNDAQLANRFQIIFDAIATATERFHVDPRHVYATGVSGGGKISSMLWACFPDVFAGAVPIVGLACYENIPIGDGHWWPGNFNKPEARLWALLKQHRAAAITGNKDFNYEPIMAAAKVFKRDGLPVRTFVQEGMGHELPTAEMFTEAMSWVDEPYRTIRAAEESKATAALAKVKKELPSIKDADQRRKKLVEVTSIGPWTPASWEAVEMLEAEKK